MRTTATLVLTLCRSHSTARRGAGSGRRELRRREEDLPPRRRPQSRVRRHDHMAGCHVLAKRINEALGIEAVVVSGFPKDKGRSTARRPSSCTATAAADTWASPHIEEARRAERARASASAASTTPSKSPRSKAGRRIPRLDGRLLRDRSARSTRTGRRSSTSSPSTRSPAASSRSRPTTSGTTTCGSARTWKA